MATRKPGPRELGLTAAAGLGLMAGALAALAVQRRTIDSLRVRLDHLEETTQTQRHADLAAQQRLHWELLSKAIDNPELAEVLDVFEGQASPERRRQFLFANALYTNQVFAYRVGNISREEFFGFVRGLFQNPIVRDYWYAVAPTGNHRGRLGRGEARAPGGRPPASAGGGRHGRVVGRGGAARRVT